MSVVFFWTEISYFETISVFIYIVVSCCSCFKNLPNGIHVTEMLLKVALNTITP